MSRMGAQRCFIIFALMAILASAQSAPRSAPFGLHVGRYHKEKGKGWGGHDPQEPRLLTAIRDGNLEAVQQLAAEIANFNYVYYPHDRDEASSEVGISPLVLAVGSEHPDIVAFLLDRGASPNFAAPNEDSPLMYAAFLDDVKSARLLLRRGANVNYRNKDGETALLYAAANADGTPMLRTLIDAGANVQAIDNNGNNGLIFAARAYNLKAVEYLIQKGIDPCASNYDGETALDLTQSTFASDPVKPQILSLLRKSCHKL